MKWIRTQCPLPPGLIGLSKNRKLTEQMNQARFERKPLSVKIYQTRISGALWAWACQKLVTLHWFGQLHHFSWKVKLRHSLCQSRADPRVHHVHMGAANTFDIFVQLILYSVCIGSIYIQLGSVSPIRSASFGLWAVDNVVIPRIFNNPTEFLVRSELGCLRKNYWGPNILGMQSPEILGFTIS